jgi:CHAD domain-containing protein
MPYAIERDETLSAAVMRIMDEQILRVRERLTDPQAPIEERIHDARKRFKETRALIRLVRDPLGAQFAVENAWYRDAGRELAAARDDVAIVEALGKLPLSPATMSRARKALAKSSVPGEPLDAVSASLAARLDAAQARLSGWPPIGDSFDAVAAGLARTYRDGRRAMKSLRSPEDLHEWRKRVKEHWYHVQLLRNVWPPVMKAYAGALENLSRALGDHHDLHVLRERLGPRFRVVNAAIATRQRALEAEARQIGRRVYAEETSRWLARIRKYWTAWRR